MSGHDLMVLARVRALAGLRDWPPVGNLIDDAIAAARGHRGLTDMDAARLDRWAKRWEPIPAELREWFERNAGEACVSPMLWHVLDMRGRPSPGAVGRLYALWERQHGYRPPYSLTPRP